MPRRASSLSLPGSQLPGTQTAAALQGGLRKLGWWAWASLQTHAPSSVSLRDLLWESLWVFHSMTFSLSVSPSLSCPGQFSGQHCCPRLPTPEPSPGRRSRRALEGLGVVTSAWEAGCAAQGPGREDLPPRGEAGTLRPFSAVQLTSVGPSPGPSPQPQLPPILCSNTHLLLSAPGLSGNLVLILTQSLICWVQALACSLPRLGPSLQNGLESKGPASREGGSEPCLQALPSHPHTLPLPQATS